MIRHKCLIFVTLIVAVFVWIGTEEWRYSNFPSTCPFSDYLPNSAVPTKCEYEGLISFSVEFQATGSPSNFDSFVKQLTEHLPNPAILEQPYTRIDGDPVFLEHDVKITADNGILVDIRWAEGVISMFYTEG